MTLSILYKCKVAVLAAIKQVATIKPTAASIKSRSAIALVLILSLTSILAATSIPAIFPAPKAFAINQQTLPIKSVVKIIADNEVSGSGIVVDYDEGYIITNAHVVLKDNTFKRYNRYDICTIQSAADEINCEHFAQLLYADQKKDLALLQVSGNPPNFPDKEFAQPLYNINDIASPEIGGKITVLGFPGLGGETITVSQGIVSGFLKNENSEIAQIKTDSSVLNGNSGGLAIDEEGKFIGVPSAYLSNFSGSGIGIIISGAEIKKWYKEIKEEMYDPIPKFTPPKIITEQPGTIDDLRAQKLSPTSVKLTWSRPVSIAEITSYEIIYDKKPLFEKSLPADQHANYFKTKNAETVFTATNLERGKIYYFAVAPVDKNGRKSPTWSHPDTIMNLGSGEEIGKRLFIDIEENHKNLYALRYLKNSNIISGYPDQSFKPGNTVTRAELAKIIVLGFQINIDAQFYNDCFSDVKNEWFAQYVCYAKEKGWVSGYNDNSFKPAQEVNVAEALKIMQKAYGMPFDKVPLDDVPEHLKKQWYAPYFKLATEFGITFQSLESMKPEEKISRLRAAEFLYRTILLESYGKKYSPQEWKDVDGKEIDLARYMGMRDGLKKEYNRNMMGANEAIIGTIKKGCTNSKIPNCFKLNEKEGQIEIAVKNNAVRSFWEKSTATDNAYIFESGRTLLKKHDSVEYIRPDKAIIAQYDGTILEIYDGLGYIEFLGNEKVQTPNGEQNAIKVKQTTLFDVKVKIGSIEFPSTLKSEIVEYLVKDIGDAKQEVKVSLVGKEELEIAKYSNELTKISQPGN